MGDQTPHEPAPTAQRLAQSRHEVLEVGEGVFVLGEDQQTAAAVVQLMDDEGNILGVAKTKLDAQQIAGQLKAKNIIAAHADDIVMF